MMNECLNFDNYKHVERVLCDAFRSLGHEPFNDAGNVFVQFGGSDELGDYGEFFNLTELAEEIIKVQQ